MEKKNEKKCKEENCSGKIEFGDEDGDYCSNHWLVKFPNQRSRVAYRRNPFLSARKKKAKYRGYNCLCTPSGPDPDCSCLGRLYDSVGLNQNINIRDMYSNGNASY